MIRIIENRGTGKTSRLMLIAKENNAYFVCKNPKAMEQKALAYGITGLKIINWDEFITNNNFDEPYVIDELEEFIKYKAKNLLGYSISIN